MAQTNFFTFQFPSKIYANLSQFVRGVSTAGHLQPKRPTPHHTASSRHQDRPRSPSSHIQVEQARAPLADDDITAIRREMAAIEAMVTDVAVTRRLGNMEIMLKRVATKLEEQKLEFVGRESMVLLEQLIVADILKAEKDAGSQVAHDPTITSFSHLRQINRTRFGDIIQRYFNNNWEELSVFYTLKKNGNRVAHPKLPRCNTPEEVLAFLLAGPSDPHASHKQRLVQLMFTLLQKQGRVFESRSHRPTARGLPATHAPPLGGHKIGVSVLPRV